MATGLLLIPLAGLPWGSLFENRILLAKLLLLLALISLLSVIHFGIQPAIERLLSQVKGDEIPKEITDQITPLRVSRKRLAAVCLFIVITAVLLGLQVFAFFGFFLTAAFIALAALFSWRVYRTPIRFGWLYPPDEVKHPVRGFGRPEPLLPYEPSSARGSGSNRDREILPSAPWPGDPLRSINKRSHLCKCAVGSLVSR